MKHFMIVMILASFFTGMAFAAETGTECPMMAEANERSNPKANLKDKLEAIKEKSKKRNGGATKS